MEEATSTKYAASKLRILNNILTLLAVCLGVYVMISPFLPEITWWVGKNTPVKTYADNSADVQEAANTSVGPDNRLFIPSLGMDELIHEGGLEQLKRGVLRRQHTSSPDRGSNTVLVGHRFAYGARGVFYHLDKVKKDDVLILHWESRKYEYKVTDIIVVPPNQVSVEEPTDASILTVYTCTPLWTATDRLVIKATLQGGQE